MTKLKVSKEKLLQWYEDNRVNLSAKQVRAYNSDDWDSFVNTDVLYNKEKEMCKEYFEEVEPEPNYNEWIGEDCVFSDEEFDLEEISNNEIYESILLSYNLGTTYEFRSGLDVYKYCMLKKDYVKLLKEQRNETSN